MRIEYDDVYLSFHLEVVGFWGFGVLGFWVKGLV